MRELKFRQFVNGKWHYWGFIEEDKTFVGPASLIEENYQYTGLRDKKRTKKYPKGQEIYEGDIVRHWKISFGDSPSGYADDVLETLEDHHFLTKIKAELSLDKKPEIIGNIYNHQILKEGTQ